MNREISADTLIGYLLSMIDDVNQMKVNYELLTEVIDEEMKVIKTSQYQSLETVVFEKIRISDNIENHFESLNLTARNLLGFYKNHFSCEETSVRDLSHCAFLFESFAPKFKGKNILVDQTFTFNLQKFKNLILFFQETAEKYKNKLELNKVAVGLIARSYQESHKFWRELLEEKSAPYDSHGHQKASGTLSSFVAKV